MSCQPSGIHNPGNFCYIISAMQTLKTLKPLLNFYIRHSKMDMIYNDIITCADITTLVTQQELQAGITRLSDEYAINPDVLKSVVDKYGLSDTDIKWYLDKIYKENTKIYLYVMIREFINALNAGPKQPASTKPLEQSPAHNNIHGLPGQTSAQTSSVARTFTPRNLIRVISTVFKDFGMEHLCNGAQNDAQEFITVLLDYLCDSHSLPSAVQIPKHVLELTEKDMDSIEDLATRIKCGLLREIHMRYSKEFTSLNAELYFYNLNQIKCPQCEFSSLSYCPNNMLCIPLPEYMTSTYTLYNCLDKFFDLEMLDGDYPCSKCGNKQNMGIRRYILTKPKTLIICLKRFHFNPRSMGLCKNNRLVLYPDLLDIRKYNPIADQDPENTQYQLTGIINHSGDINFGHYYSWNKVDNKWWQHNDAIVTPITCLPHENPGAYILTYEKTT